jgi:hypothetical protein
MKHICTKTEFTITLVILTVLWVVIAHNLKKERETMSTEFYVGQEGVTVNVENKDDILEAIDQMHSQAIQNIGIGSDEVDILNQFIDELHERFDFEDDDDDES